MTKAIRMRTHGGPEVLPLQAAAQAHRDLEARQTTGSTLLIP